LAGTPGIVLVLTAGEEGGCVGSQHLAARPDLMARAGAIVCSASRPRTNRSSATRDRSSSTPAFAASRRTARRRNSA
ncbi:MAG: hypothetical protein RML56_01095, partial [Burkholderiales bacterium]|nr:hypothetical protein [Burkholderiales bacterium]